jgi:hypothetical protein
VPSENQKEALEKPNLTVLLFFFLFGVIGAGLKPRSSPAHLSS